jgi:histidyl-tRNA synthetase
LAKANPTHLENKDSTKTNSEYFWKALRYDLTVPFARYVVQHQNDIEFPFKRYQIQPVWEQIVRKRTFQRVFQCDADVVGSKSCGKKLNWCNCTTLFFTALYRRRNKSKSITEKYYQELLRSLAHLIN